MKIQILGIGCEACRQLEADVRELLPVLQVEAQVERVEDLEQILTYPLWALPGLVIDGQVVACGYPGKKQIEHQLRSYIEDKQAER